MQLTGTNSSIDLIVLIINIHQRRPRVVDDRIRLALTDRTQLKLLILREDGQKWPTCGRTCEHCVFVTEALRSYARKTSFLFVSVPFADLVVMAERLHPIPFRTRP